MLKFFIIEIVLLIVFAINENFHRFTIDNRVYLLTEKYRYILLIVQFCILLFLVMHIINSVSV